MRHIIISFLALIAISPVHADDFAAKPAIKIGGIFSLSGFGAHGGTGELRAAQLAIGKINALGGIKGHKIDLIVEDNQSDLKACATAFNKLVQVDNIDALIGPNWSEFTEIVAPLAERERVPMITPSGVLNSAVNRRYVFSLMQPPIETIRSLAEAVLAQHDVKEVLGLVQDNLYLENAWSAAKEIWGNKFSISEVRVNTNQNPDYRSILLSRAKKPGIAIFASILPGQYSPLLKARKQLGIKAPVYAVDILYDEGRPTDEQTNAAVIGTDFIVLGSDKFHHDYIAKFGEKPLNYGAKAFDAITILAEAYVECGRRNYKCIETIDRYGESGHLKFGRDHVVVAEGPVAENYEFVGTSWQKVNKQN